MSQRNQVVTFDEVWNRLEKHIEHLYQGQGVSKITQLELYT
jgi:hypothetical protein